MKRLKELARRLRYLGQQARFDRELEDEMRFHIETRAEELEKSGLDRKEALAHARREFGSTVLLKEHTRAAWQIRWLEDLTRDVRYALRALSRNPGFAAAAISSLALGIGANTTMFSLTMEFLFSQPSCRNPQTLASIGIGGNSNVDIAKYRFLRDAHVFDGLAGSDPEAESNWRFGEDTYDLHVMRVTQNFFQVVGVPVAMGRPIEQNDHDVVVLSHRFWRSRLAADRDVLGKVLFIDGRPMTVIGVLPRNHRTVLGFGFSPDLYLPVSGEEETVALIARLPEGMSRQTAYQRLIPLCKALDSADPESVGPNFSWANHVEVIPVAGVERLKSLEIAPFAAFFGMLMAVVGLVLLIACANVSSLLLARASSQRRELAIRLAIGANRGRIVRQLLAESLLLAMLGTSAGLLLNLWCTGIFNRVQLPLPIPIELLIQPDWRLLLYSMAVAAVSALAAGVMPAMRSTRGAVGAALKLEERQVGGRWTLRNALVVWQLAVSVVLLATGVLFVRNLTKAMSMTPGFDADHAACTYVRLVPGKYRTAGEMRDFVGRALNELHALPGAESASVAHTVPFNDQVTRGGEISTDVDAHPMHIAFNHNYVGPEYFKTLGISVLAGREFAAADRSGAPEVAILNRNLAERLFGNKSAIGHTIRCWDRQILVVGVVKNSKYFSLGEERPLAMYGAYFQQETFSERMHFVVRSSRPKDVVRGIRTALGRLDSSAAIEAKPMRDALGFAFLPSRVGAALLGSMGLLGLALASMGLYGVLAYAVSRRIREIGLRIALGADRRAIVGMVVRQSFALVMIGLAIGLGIAVFATKPLALFLVPELSPTDPATFLAVAGVLLAVALAATLGPAMRALRVDPMTALRYE